MKKTAWENAQSGFWFLALTVILCMVSLWQYRVVRQELPCVVEWYAQSDFTYSEGQLQQLAESAQAGFYVQAWQTVEDEILGRTEEMAVRWADAEYFAWSGIRLEAGQWPGTASQSGTQDADQDPDAAGEAAVSADWAVEHYKYTDVTGQTVRIGGDKYQISGVYRPNGSWRQQMAGDGADIMYLCFQPGHLSGDYRMDYLYFAKEGGDFQCSQSYLEDIAASATGVRAAPDISLDVESVRHVCMQNIVVCGILWLLLAAVFLGRAGKKALGYLALAACAACISFYQWYIPMAYLPRENVFDFAGYIQRYIKGQNLRHLYQENGYFGNLAYMHVWISWGILGLELITAVCAAVGEMVRRRRKWP